MKVNIRRLGVRSTERVIVTEYRLKILTYITTIESSEMELYLWYSSTLEYLYLYCTRTGFETTSVLK